MPLLETVGSGSARAFGLNSSGISPFYIVTDAYFRYDVSDPNGLQRSGATVNKLLDLTGNNIHSTTVGSPQYSATGWNSRPAISFNGSNQGISTDLNVTFSDAQSLNIFMVTNITASGGLFIEHTPDANRGAGTSFYVYSITGNSYMYNAGSLTSSYQVGNNGGAWAAGCKLITYRYEGTNSGHIVRRDKVTQSTSANGESANPGWSSTNDEMYFMSRGNNSLWTQGTVSEIIVYKKAMTFSQMQQVENYLSNKWGF
jgi:hypothetical protein